ncbi:MAG: glutathione S-transferase family protein [Polaromonas sp.]
MHLFGSTDSGHSFKVRSYLQLSGIAHSYEWIDLSTPRASRPAHFKAASKFGEVPVLVDGGHTLCQSNAILLYLAGKTGKFAGATQDQQHVLEWLCWEANRIGFSVPNLRYAMRWAKQPPDVLRYLRSRAVTDLSALNATLGASEYLLPSGPTIADISCSAYLHWLEQTEVSVSEYPNLERWLCSLRQLPGWEHPSVALQPARASEA